MAALDEHADLSFVFAAVEELAKALDHAEMVVTKSTVPVGTRTRPPRCSRSISTRRLFGRVKRACGSPSRRPDQSALMLRIRNLAATRFYRQGGLSLRLKRPRRNVSAANRERQPAALAANEMWSMGFVSDALFDGQGLRALTVVDAFTCEALAIDVNQGIKGEQVVQAMSRIAMTRDSPRTIRVDNGPEFISKALDRWAYENGVTLDFSGRGKPTDNAFLESFNGRLRDECLNAHWLLSLADARAKIEAWRRDYNESRPYTSLGWMTPIKCAADLGPDGRRMNAGYSPSAWMRNRGTFNVIAICVSSLDDKLTVRCDETRLVQTQYCVILQNQIDVGCVFNSQTLVSPHLL